MPQRLHHRHESRWWEWLPGLDLPGSAAIGAIAAADMPGYPGIGAVRRVLARFGKPGDGSVEATATGIVKAAGGKGWKRVIRRNVYG
jgi:hypothetical protein